MSTYRTVQKLRPHSRTAVAMTFAIGVVTVAWFSQLAVRTDAGLRVRAPEQAIVAGRHGGVRLGIDK